MPSILGKQRSLVIKTEHPPRLAAAICRASGIFKPKLALKTYYFY